MACKLQNPFAPLNEKEQRQATPIIALTASVIIEDRKQTQEAGMNGFAVKPIETAALFAEIARVLGYQTQAIIQSDENESSLDWQRGESLWAVVKPYKTNSNLSCRLPTKILRVTTA